MMAFFSVFGGEEGGVGGRDGGKRRWIWVWLGWVGLGIEEEGNKKKVKRNLNQPYSHLLLPPPLPSVLPSLPPSLLSPSHPLILSSSSLSFFFLLPLEEKNKGDVITPSPFFYRFFIAWFCNAPSRPSHTPLFSFSKLLLFYKYININGVFTYDVSPRQTAKQRNPNPNPNHITTFSSPLLFPSLLYSTYPHQHPQSPTPIIHSPFSTLHCPSVPPCLFFNSVITRPKKTRKKTKKNPLPRALFFLFS